MSFVGTQMFIWYSNVYLVLKCLFGTQMRRLFKNLRYFKNNAQTRFSVPEFLYLASLL